MSVLAGPRAGTGSTAPAEPSRRNSRIPAVSSPVWPVVAAIVDALAFFFVRPNVGDLQAALARQAAAASGVGLTYWFQWFGGGAAPGSYSVITPGLSTVIGAPLVGVLAAIALAPLAWRAAEGTPYRLAATWIAVFTTGWNLWAGRIPFALGCTVAVVGVIALRDRRLVLAAVATIASSLCSPVTGAFLAFVAVAAMLVERSYRRVGTVVLVTCGAALVFIAIFFGSPGPQGFAVASGFLTAGTALAMLVARPSAAVRAVLWCTALAAVVLTCFPNGMGSNFTRLPWICLPAAVVATATASRRWVALGVLPALALCVNTTVVDLVRSSVPSASAGYYRPLIRRLDRLPGLDNYRLEVVSNPVIHTASYALLGHAALAGGYETQEQNALNHILTDRAHLNATSYKVWLDNNAVGYVALDRQAVNSSPEYQLVRRHRLPYLRQIGEGRKWLLYRVQNPTPIVPPPAQLLRATQAQLRIRVPCACQLAIRVRYSGFLDAVQPHSTVAATVRDDGTGWTVVTTPRPGVYVLAGSLTHPLR